MEEYPFTLTRPDGEQIHGEMRIAHSEEGQDPSTDRQHSSTDRQHPAIHQQGPSTHRHKGSAREGPPRTAVVIIHGFKGFRRWGFFPHLARRLAEAGHAAITFDFSRNGVGPGGEDFDELEAFAKNTFTRELEEVAQVVEALEGGQLPAPAPERIALLGHSRGGGTAILAASELSDTIDALITWAAVASFDRWGDEVKEEWRREGRIHIPNARTGQDMPLDIGLLEDLERHRSRLDIQAAAQRIKMPWCIIHGTRDESVPVEEARKLHAVAASAELELIPGAGHTFGAGHPFGAESSDLTKAIERTRSHLRRTWSDDLSGHAK